MPMIYQAWEKRDAADAREWGLALLQWCRVNRGRPGVIDARYWIQAPSTAAVLIEFEPGADVLAGFDSEEYAKAVIEIVSRSNGFPW